MHLILASASPRRQELLRGLGLDFTIQTADIDETMDPAQGAAAEVARVSRKKADAILAVAPADAVVIAADTIVCIDDKILGKPISETAAVEMLQTLSGRNNQVRTGVTVCSHQASLTRVVTTDVCFRDLSPDEILAYVATGEPMDKAGAYGIQGLASIFVRELHGDYFNVMGLPLCALSQMLQQFGIAILSRKD